MYVRSMVSRQRLSDRPPFAGDDGGRQTSRRPHANNRPRCGKPAAWGNGGRRRGAKGAARSRAAWPPRGVQPQRQPRPGGWGVVATTPAAAALAPPETSNHLDRSARASVA
eukprot:5545922-Alexandrium_andersonii.AAC.1